jgi:hypothetical protein
MGRQGWIITMTMGFLRGRAWRTTLPVAAGALLILFGIGYLVGDALAEDSDPPLPSLIEEESPTPPAIPAGDAAGEDLPLLGRYPGSVRSAFEQGALGDLAVTRVRYLATAELDDVRRFYRAAFRETPGLLVAACSMTTRLGGS